jgi:hypothetical protein
MGIMIVVSDTANFEFIMKFDIGSWLILCTGSLVTILASTTKFLAYKHHEASDLQKMAFLPNVWQFVLDIVFLNAIFNDIQITGFAMLFTFYAGYLTFILFEKYRRP